MLGPATPTRALAVDRATTPARRDPRRACSRWRSLVLALALTASLALLPPPPAAHAQPAIDRALTTELIDRFNALRASEGNDPLVIAGDLQQVAEAWAIQLVEQERLAQNPQVADRVCCSEDRPGDGGDGSGDILSIVDWIGGIDARGTSTSAAEAAELLFDNFIRNTGPSFTADPDDGRSRTVGIAVATDGDRLLRLAAITRNKNSVAWGSPPDTWPRPDVLDAADACTGAVTAEFGDVAATNVHAAGIDCVAELNITQGLTATSYGPDRPVSRGQMATFLVRMLEGQGLELADRETTAFDDIAGNTHQIAIERLAAAGIVQGSGGGFRPDASVNRAQMATFLIRAYEAAGGDPRPDPAFYDFFVDDWVATGAGPGATHGANIQRVAEIGVTDGIAGPVGFYGADRTVNRAQMASFLSRLVVAIETL